MSLFDNFLKRFAADDDPYEEIDLSNTDTDIDEFVEQNEEESIVDQKEYKNDLLKLVGKCLTIIMQLNSLSEFTQGNVEYLLNNLSVILDDILQIAQENNLEEIKDSGSNIKKLIEDFSFDKVKTEIGELSEKFKKLVYTDKVVKEHIDYIIKVYTAVLKLYYPKQSEYYKSVSPEDKRLNIFNESDYFNEIATEMSEQSSRINEINAALTEIEEELNKLKMLNTDSDSLDKIRQLEKDKEVLEASRDFYNNNIEKLKPLLNKFKSNPDAYGFDDKQSLFVQDIKDAYYQLLQILNKFKTEDFDYRESKPENEPLGLKPGIMKIQKLKDVTKESVTQLKALLTDADSKRLDDLIKNTDIPDISKYVSTFSEKSNELVTLSNNIFKELITIKKLLGSDSLHDAKENINIFIGSTVKYLSNISTVDEQVYNYIQSLFESFVNVPINKYTQDAVAKCQASLKDLENKTVENLKMHLTFSILYICADGINSYIYTNFTQSSSTDIGKILSDIAIAVNYTFDSAKNIISYVSPLNKHIKQCIILLKPVVAYKDEISSLQVPGFNFKNISTDLSEFYHKLVDYSYELTSINESVQNLDTTQLVTSNAYYVTVLNIIEYLKTIKQYFAENIEFLTNAKI